MKTLVISEKEIKNLEIPPSWYASSQSYFDFWIEEKLKETGFDLTKEYKSYKDFATLNILFYQEY